MEAELVDDLLQCSFDRRHDIGKSVNRTHDVCDGPDKHALQTTRTALLLGRKSRNDKVPRRGGHHEALFEGRPVGDELLWHSTRFVRGNDLRVHGGGQCRQNPQDRGLLLPVGRGGLLGHRPSLTSRDRTAGGSRTYSDRLIIALAASCPDVWSV